MALEVPDEPLQSGAPYWYWLGGRPAVDLVNTRRQRRRRDVECLVSDSDVVEWLAQAGLLAERTPAPRGILASARELREATDAALRAAVAGEAPDPAALAAIDARLAPPGPRLTLRPGPDGLPVLVQHEVASPWEALDLVALDAAQALGRPEERARLRICAAEECSVRFYDRSPAGRRRWCSMARCGNVEKARRHRERARP